MLFEINRSMGGNEKSIFVVRFVFGWITSLKQPATIMDLKVAGSLVPDLIFCYIMLALFYRTVI